MSRNIIHPLQKYGYIFLFKSDTNYVDAHSHSYLEIGYVLSGQALHKYERHIDTLSEGDYYIIDHGKVHEYMQIGETPLVVLNCMFVPRFFHPALANQTNLDSLFSSQVFSINFKSITKLERPLFHDKDGIIRSLLLEMYDEYTEKESGHQDMLRSLLTNVLVQTFRKLNTSSSSDIKHPVIESLLNYINSNYFTKSPLQDFAKNEYYSLAYISRLFKKEVGITIQEYILQTRINVACYLLSNTDLKIENIAAKVGYNDSKFFTKTFKTHTKYTPREYRKKYASISIFLPPDMTNQEAYLLYKEGLIPYRSE